MKSGSRTTQAAGRPRKFSAPSRPVTVTLPETTLAQLAAVDTDRARAIVKATSAMISGAAPHRKQVNIVKVSPGIGMIVVAPSRMLRKIPFLRLVEVAPGRFLLSLSSGTSAAALEVAIHDMIETTPPTEDWERSLLTELAGHLKSIRINNTAFKGEMLFVNL